MITLVKNSELRVSAMDLAIFSTSFTGVLGLISFTSTISCSPTLIT